MQTVVGIFRNRSQAERSIDRLRSIGFKDDQLNLLYPGVPAENVEAVPTTAAEQPGMGKALGGVVGAAIGTGGGLSLGTALAAGAIPGVGPVVAAGLLAGALLGVGGALGGAAVGGAIERATTEGLPQDEIFFYEDALRHGRSLVIALAEDDRQAEAARVVLLELSAESLDAARQEWWLGLRDVEEEHYEPPLAFRDIEPVYRRGFLAALGDLRGKTYEESEGFLRSRYPDVWQEPAFRKGFERGRSYWMRLLAERPRAA